MHDRRFAPSPLAALALAALPLASCTVTAAREERRAFPGPVERVLLRTRSGDARIAMTPRNDVAVRLRSTYVGSAKPSPLVELHDGVLEASYTRDPGLHASIDFDIELPSGVTEVFARTESGDVELLDLVGDIDVRTGSGDVEATSLFASQAEVATGSGDVELSFSAPPEWVEIETGSGDVVLELPGAGWNLRVRSGSGDVDVAPGMRGDSGERRVSITTGSGDVVVRPR